MTRGEGRENGTVLSVEAVEVGVRDTGQNDLNVKLKMLRERDTKSHREITVTTRPIKNQDQH